MLVPDHRGSTGHGRAYQQALTGRWGELDVADTAAVVRHAHRAGWATPERTVLIGGSAGGFTVLGVLARHPDLAAAAVVVVSGQRPRRPRRAQPPLRAPLHAVAGRRRADRPTSTSGTATFAGVVRPGDPHAAAGVPRRRRPRRAGRAEPRARRADARRRRAGRAVRPPGEGHGFRQRHHQIDEYDRTAAFLRRHMP